jgi:hypothetical protein
MAQKATARTDGFKIAAIRGAMCRDQLDKGIIKGKPDKPKLFCNLTLPVDALRQIDHIHPVKKGAHHRCSHAKRRFSHRVP